MALNMIPEKISTRFRIGIIGPGSICVTYGNALKASDTVSLACICGRDTEKGRKTAERFQVPYYTDQEQMYRNEALDGVLICTPTYTHEEMVRRALARRVPVMCEKPLALDAETARRLVADAADADVPFMVMQVVRFWPEYRALAPADPERTAGEDKKCLHEPSLLSPGLDCLAPGSGKIRRRAL